MKRLRALTAISSSVGAIPAGVQFLELDDMRADELIRTGCAAPVAEGASVEPGTPRAPHWPGFEVVIIASGESLTLAQCAAAAEWRAGATGRRAVAINTSFRRAQFADVLYACDGHWWDAYHAEVASLFTPDQLWTQDLRAAQRYGLQYVPSGKGEGLAKQPGTINQGQSSGYQALNLVVNWGARRVILLGYDAEGGHWHGDHPSPMNARLPHAAWVQAFAKLAPDLKLAGVEVINCSPKSAIKAFPQRELMEVLCLQSAPSESSPTIDAKPLSTDSAAPVTHSPIKGGRKRKEISSSSGTATD